jgi:hypothetical protein
LNFDTDQLEPDIDGRFFSITRTNFPAVTSDQTNEQENDIPSLLS